MANYGYGGGYTTTANSYGGGQGGADGGGFVGGSQAGSQDTPSGAKSYGKDTIRPVTIKQVLEATFAHPSAEAKIDGADIYLLSVVGQILKVQSQATNTTFQLDDGTGTIDVKQWIDADAAPEHVKAMPKEGDYIHVWGTIKDFGGRRNISIRTIRAITTDFNEITYHLLEAITIHLHLTKGPPGNAANGGLFVGGANEGAGATATTVAGGKPVPRNMSKNGLAVFKFLQDAPQGNEGLHVANIASRLGISQADVFKAGDELLAEGMIYTTIDDETWAVLEY